ncbi:hypothetical protein SO694_00001956 [Aureococcus anophagefferens]|uniref:CHAT domain-containing protein n=1 Tax=Aureococcus anophagefferens TaxID=44056 RepID=A0ABR1GCC3_AURAN
MPAEVGPAEEAPRPRGRFRSATSGLMSKLWMRRRSKKTSKVVPTMKTLVVAPAGTPTRSISTETCGTPTSPFDGQPFRLGYLCAEPLVYRKPDGSFGALPPVQSRRDGEVSLLKAVLARSETAVRFRSAVATVTELRSLLTVGCDALHFSGHGLPRSLSFELEGRAELTMVGHDRLEALFAAGGHRARLVFAAACKSEFAGRAFARHVPHVICVRVDARLGDRAARDMAEQFYAAILRGRTVREAFDIGVAAVGAAGAAYLLLPEDGDHDVPLFLADRRHFAAVAHVDDLPKAPLSAFLSYVVDETRQPYPRVVERFLEAAAAARRACEGRGGGSRRPSADDELTPDSCARAFEDLADLAGGNVLVVVRGASPEIRGLVRMISHLLENVPGLSVLCSGESLHGGAERVEAAPEKVYDLPPLPRHDMARLLDDLAPRRIPDAELLGLEPHDDAPRVATVTPTTRKLLAPIARGPDPADDRARALDAFAAHGALLALEGNAKAAVAFAPKLSRDLRDPALPGEAARCLRDSDASPGSAPSFWAERGF